MDGLWVMSESLLYENKLDKNGKIGDIWNTPFNSDSDYIIICDLTYPDDIRDETRNFPLSVEKKLVLKMNLVNVWMKWNQINIRKKLFCVWTEKRAI